MDFTLILRSRLSLLSGLLFLFFSGITSYWEDETNGKLILVSEATSNGERLGDLEVVLNASTSFASRRVRVSPVRIHGDGSQELTEMVGRFGIDHGPASLSFPSLLAGRYVVNFETLEGPDRGATGSILTTVRPGEAQVLEVGKAVTLIPVRGRVTLGKTAVAEATVTSLLMPNDRGLLSGGSYSTTTNAKGEYELLLPAGEVALQIRAKITNAMGYVFSGEIPAGEDCDLDLPLPENGASGVVLSMKGKPLAGVDVSLTPSRDGADTFRLSQYGRSRTDDLGRFAFQSLMPGTYYLSCGGPGWRGAVGENELGRAATMVVIPNLVERIEGLQLNLCAPQNAKGRATLSDGSPASLARIYMREKQTQEPWSYAGTTNSKGEFHAQGLSAGEWEIQATLQVGEASYASALSSFHVAPDSPTPNLHLPLDLTQAQTLRLEGNGDNPLAFRVLVFDEAGSVFPYMGEQTLLRYEHRIEFLRQGKYLLRAWPEVGEATELRIDVSEDSVLPLR